MTGRGPWTLWRATLVAAACLGPGGPSEAGEFRVRTDRPDRSNSLDTIPPGMAQIESGVAYGRDASGDRPVRRLTIEGNVRLGLTETIEIDLPGTLFVRERGEGQGTSGLGDTALAGKWRLVEADGWRPALGVQPFVKFPTASRSKGLGSGRVDFGGILAAGVDLPADLHVDLNFGLTAVSLAEEPGGRFLQRAAAASFSWEATDWLTPFWEIFYSSREKPSGLHSVGTDFGVILTLPDRVALDLAAEFRLAGATPDWVLRAGFTLLLGSFADDGARSTSRRAPPGEPSVAWAGQASGARDTRASPHPSAAVDRDRAGGVASSQVGASRPGGWP